MQDGELIEQLQEGNLDALGEIYNRHHRMVYHTAFVITGDSEVARDLSQDVFLRLYRFAKKVDPQRPLPPWLYRMTVNLAYTWVRRNRLGSRLVETMAGWLQSASRRPTPHEMTERKEQWEQVEGAISSLPLAQRVVVVMYYLNDLSLQEIADALEIPEGTVKSRLHYARIALKNRLGLSSSEDDQALPEFKFESP